MKKTVITLCIIIFALVLGIGAFVLNSEDKQENTTLITGQTGGDCDNTQMQTDPGFDLAKILDESETLGDFCKYSMYYTVQSSQWVIYREQGKQDMKYSIGVACNELINELITSNYDKKAENTVSTTGEALVFESSFNGEKGIISTVLCSDGYLYISCEDVTKGYNIGADLYDKFMKDFEYCSCLWTAENPVTIG